MLKIIQKDDIVLITGLVSQKWKHLNNRLGRVREFLPVSQRWTVTVIESDWDIAVHAKNLIICK